MAPSVIFLLGASAWLSNYMDRTVMPTEVELAHPWQYKYRWKEDKRTGAVLTGWEKKGIDRGGNTYIYSLRAPQGGINPARAGEVKNRAEWLTGPHGVQTRGKTLTKGKHIKTRGDQ